VAEETGGGRAEVVRAVACGGGGAIAPGCGLAPAAVVPRSS
jgi:hypothetical protein